MKTFKGVLFWVNMTGRLFLLWSFFMVCAIGFAQQPYYRFRHISPNQGLSDAKINCVGQDKYGFIWIGTGYGLNRYDGYGVEVFRSETNDSTSIPNMDVRHQFTSSMGNIYFGTLGGFSRFDYKLHQFEPHPFGISKLVGSFCEPLPAVLFIYGTYGLLQVDEKSGKVIFLKQHQDTLIRKLAGTSILDMAVSDQGLIYFATSYGLYTLDIHTWKISHYTHHDNDPTSICSNDIRSIAIDHDGIVWIGTDYYGARLTRFDPKERTFKVYHQFNSLRNDWADNRIMDLRVDRKNRLWIATLRAGIALYDRQRDDFHYYLHDPMDEGSIASNSILSLFEDKDGAMWIGTEGYGLDYFQPDLDYFTTISISSKQTPTLPDPLCRAIAEDRDGNFWIGTYKGLSFYNPVSDRFSNFLSAKKENSEANNSVRTVLVDDEGMVWVGTGGGLYRLDAKTMKPIPFLDRDSIPVVFTGHLIQDKEKNIWISTARGLLVYRKAGNKSGYAFTTKATVSHQREPVSCVLEDHHGRLWLSAPRKGLLMYDESKDTVRVYEFSKILPRLQAYDYINSMAEDRNGIIWMCTWGGLVSFNPAHEEIRIYTEQDGLPSNKVSGVLVDTLNRIWIGTGKGLCVLEADRRTFHSFDTYDGLPTNYFYEGNAYKLPDGRFAYPTYNGIVMFSPEQINPVSFTIPPMVTSFVVAGATPTFQSAIPDLDYVKLKHNENFFTLEMTGLHYANPLKVTYAYILEGFDPGWHYTKERRVNYTNVPGGKYVFRYKAAENPLLPGTLERTMIIEIGTVFYKTWWFVLLAGLILAMLVYSFVRWRFLEQQRIHELKNKAQLLEKEKALVMYENLRQHLNPHFLFNSLASLKSLIRIDQKSASEFLERMSRIYRYILKSRDNELVSLTDEIAFAQTYIDLQQSRFRKGLVVNIRVDEDYKHFKIAPVTLQNLIENAIKHNLIDEETPLVIDMYVEDGFLVVKNNLQKKEFVETSNKQGLANMQSLYHFLDPRPVEIVEDHDSFKVKIPLI